MPVSALTMHGGARYTLDLLDHLRRMLYLAPAFEQRDDPEVKEAPDANPEGGRPGTSLVIGDRDEVDCDGRDDRASAEGHQPADDHGALQLRELPNKESTDDQS